MYMYKHRQRLGLCRSRELDRESATVSGNCAAILQGVGVQAIVTEILVQYADLLFTDRVQDDESDKGKFHFPETDFNS